MTEQNFEAMRRAMVASQLRTNAVSDQRVVEAMDSVPREAFVPADRAALAYVDTPVPLGNGRALNPPMVTGRLLSEAGVMSSDKVLLIGAATGYAAAVLDRLAGRVVAVESDTELAARAATALAYLPNVQLVTGALDAGHTAGAPYDLLFIDGAVEQVPESLIRQLAPDGRIATALVDNGVTRLAIGRCAGDGLGFDIFLDAEAVVLPGFARPKPFAF